MIPELLLLCAILLTLNSISKSTSHFKLCDNLLKYTINTFGVEIIEIFCSDKGF